MVPIELPGGRAYFAGIAAAVAFRWFVAAVLVFLAFGPALNWIERQGKIVQALLAVVALATPFTVPYLAGFLAAFFWRRVSWQQEHDEINAIGTGAFLSWLPVLAATMGFSFPLLLLDIWLCGRGARFGKEFWNGDLGRQFLGDFSTRDDD